MVLYKYYKEYDVKVVDDHDNNDDSAREMRSQQQSEHLFCFVINFLRTILEYKSYLFFLSVSH